MDAIAEEEDFRDAIFVDEGNVMFVLGIDLGPLEREVFLEEI